MPALPIKALLELEKLRDSTALVYCSGEPAKFLNPHEIPIIFECLRRSGKTKRLDLILNTDGGLVTTAHRLALLLREYTDRLSILVPYKARSAGTLLCLAADEIVLGPLAEFSPLDPMIREASGPANLPQISSEDIKAFRPLIEQWFGLQTEEHRMQAFSLLAQRFFPSTLSAFFRADQYIRKIGQELLRYHLPQASLSERENIIGQFISGYSEHSHSFTRKDARDLGLQARSASPEEESLMWDIYQGSLDYMRTMNSAKKAQPTKGEAVLFSRQFAARYVTYVAPGAPPATDDGKPGMIRPMIQSAGWEEVSLA